MGDTQTDAKPVATSVRNLLEHLHTPPENPDLFVLIIEPPGGLRAYRICSTRERAQQLADGLQNANCMCHIVGATIDADR
jgi:hypothetical protein